MGLFVMDFSLWGLFIMVLFVMGTIRFGVYSLWGLFVLGSIRYGNYSIRYGNVRYGNYVFVMGTVRHEDTFA